MATALKKMCPSRPQSCSPFFFESLALAAGQAS